MLFTRVKALQKTRPQRLGLNMSNRSAPVRASAASNWQLVLCVRLNGYIYLQKKREVKLCVAQCFNADPGSRAGTPDSQL